MSGRLIVPGPGAPAMNLAFVARELTHAFDEINAQLGRLAPTGDVLVAYIVQGIQPSLQLPGRLGVNLRWITLAPACLADTGAGPCLAPAAWATIPEGKAVTYLCDTHAAALPEGQRRDTIASIVAAMNTGPKAG